jgi:Putative transposase/Transposase zinc-binding domain
MSCSVWADGSPAITLGQVVRAALPNFTQTHCLPAHHWKVLRAIAACRTPALGGHQYQCTHCGQAHFVPHSCRNRHCPTCQGLNGAQWLEHQAKDLLPIPYFHVVFTLPHALNPLIQYNQPRLYNLLFASATATLREFGQNNLSAQLGITAILHTWSQTLGDHYHLHCIVTGGGLSLDGSAWVSRPPGWLLPVRALSLVFRAKFRDGLQQLFETRQLQFPKALPGLSEPTRFSRWLHQCCRHKWVVYAKRPFAGSEAVLAYLCRYTHRVGLSNRRLEALDREAQTVTFSYKDYAHESQRRSLTLSLDEFLRRFCLHILPSRFVKIRHYGLLANRDRPLRIARARDLLRQAAPGSPLPWEVQRPVKHLEPQPLLCPHCGQPTLVLVRIIRPPRSHPPPLADTS